MLTCLTGSIGIIGCGTQNPASNLFINSLPGMSLKSLEGITTPELFTYSKMFAALEERAQAALSRKVQSLLAIRYKISLNTEYVDLGLDVDTTTITAASNQYRGIVIDYTTNFQYQYYGLANHFIELIKFYSPVVIADAPFKIFDAVTKTLLNTFTQSLVIGWNYLQIKSTFKTRSIFIGIDSSAINSVYFQVTSLGCEDCFTSNCYSNFEGATMAIASPFAIVSGQNSFGMSLVYSKRCSFDNIICQYPDQFYLAYQYYLGSEFMTEVLSSKRLNEFTLNLKQPSDLKAMYDLQAEEETKNACLSIDIDLNDCCISCDAPVSIQEAKQFH